jgi:uncharacterized protein involved in exopolysaccharide biosynthesis
VTGPNTGEGLQYDEELSLFTLGTTLLRHRWRIARWALIGGAIAAFSVAFKPALYKATASFVPQGGGDASRSAGLASIAGQLGVSLPNANASQSPEFYARLAQSRVILQPILHKPLIVKESGGKSMLLLDLLEIEAENPQRRDELGVIALQGIIDATVAKTIGGVEVSASTEWPSVSLAILTDVVQGINDFNEVTRRSQASVERKFVEQLLASKQAEVRAAEERLAEFQRANKVYQGSPQLLTEHDRFERDLMMKQQVFTSLAQSYEDAKIREVRDTPVITLLEPPYVPWLPEPRGRITSTLVGILFGAFVGSLLSFAADALARRRKAGSSDATELVAVVNEIKDGTLRRLRRTRRSS